MISHILYQLKFKISLKIQLKRSIIIQIVKEIIIINASFKQLIMIIIKIIK